MGLHDLIDHAFTAVMPSRTRVGAVEMTTADRLGAMAFGSAVIGIAGLGVYGLVAARERTRVELPRGVRILR